MRSATGMRYGNGGQTTVWTPSSAAISLATPSARVTAEARVLFIFQLPATMRRRMAIPFVGSQESGAGFGGSGRRAPAKASLYRRAAPSGQKSRTDYQERANGGAKKSSPLRRFG